MQLHHIIFSRHSTDHLHTLGDSGKNLEGFDHGGKKAAYCRYKLGLYSKLPAKSVHFSFFPGPFYKKEEKTA